MKWISRLLALFIVLPALELILLLQFNRWMGFWATVALILGTGLLGGFLARREGFNAWRRLQQRLHSAQLPGAELVDGVIILLSGALLVTPGLLSDVAGLLGLVPPVRAGLRRLVLRRLERGLARGAVQFYSASPFSTPPEDSGAAASSWQGEPLQAPRHMQEGSER